MWVGGKQATTDTVSNFQLKLRTDSIKIISLSLKKIILSGAFFVEPLNHIHYYIHSFQPCHFNYEIFWILILTLVVCVALESPGEKCVVLWGCESQSRSPGLALSYHLLRSNYLVPDQPLSTLRAANGNQIGFKHLICSLMWRCIRGGTF